MATINSLPAVGSISGTEEFVINVAGTDNKCTATQITATVTTNLAAEIVTRTSEVATLTSGKLNLAGGTMTGALTLNGAPASNLHAATKLYVDTGLAGKAAATSTSLDAASTAVTAAATATSGSTAISTTQYVEDKIYQDITRKITISAAATTLNGDYKGVLEVDYTVTGVAVINLPVIATLTNPERYEYYIVDTGKNAGTNVIRTIAGVGNTIDGTSAIDITTDGASIYIANSGGTNWYLKDKDAAASATVTGLVELATTVEAAALTDATRVVTPAGLGAAFDAFPYNITQLGAASHVLTESDTGTLYITRTTTGTCAITLPAPATLSSSARTQYAIYDAGAAGTNNATITTAGGTIDGGATFVIDNDKMGATFITNGTNWYSIANTQTAYSGGAATPWSLNGVDIYFNQEVIIGDSIAPNSLLHLDKTTGDVGLTWSQAGVAKFIAGIDDTDDNWKLSRGGTLGTTDIIDISEIDGTIGIAHPPTASTLLGLNGAAVAGVTDVLTLDDTKTTAISRALTTSLGGVSTAGKYGWRGKIDGGTENQGIILALEKGGYPSTMPATSDIGVGIELGHATRDSYGVYVNAVTSNTGDNYGLRLDIQNAGAGNAYAMQIIGGDIKIGPGFGTTIGTTATERLAFWGAAAIQQPTSVGETTGYAAVGGTNVNSNDTFTGNSGTKAYTVNDIVKHLKSVGIIATS